MKKLFALAFIAALAACGGKGNGSSTTPSNSGSGSGSAIEQGATGGNTYGSAATSETPPEDPCAAPH